MDIKDLAGLEKPLTRLIEVSASAVGVVYRDTWGVNAEVRRRKMLADVEHEIKLLELNTKNELLLRSQRRHLYQEAKRQLNIEETIREATEYLSEEVPEEKPSDDWTNNFFNIVQDVSNEEMKILWSKVLAGEVAKPGSYSKRTLEILKNLSQEEARAFKKLMSYTFGNYVIFKLGNDTSSLNNSGFYFADWKVVQEAGLVSGTEDLRITVPTPTSVFRIGSKNVVFGSNDKKVVEMPIKQLTKAGTELSRLIEVEPDEKYLKNLVNFYSQKGVEVIITDNQN